MKTITFNDDQVETLREIGLTEVTRTVELPDHEYEALIALKRQKETTHLSDTEFLFTLLIEKYGEAASLPSTAPERPARDERADPPKSTLH